MRLVDLVGISVEAGGSVVVLREHDTPHRLLSIVIGGAEAASIAIAASGQSVPRPLSHDLMAALVESLEGHLDAVEVTDLRDGTFFANLALTGPVGEHRLDTRPSDAIALAVRLHAPLYVSEHVLDEVGAIPNPGLDDEAIEAEVSDFHDFLAELDPADFLTPELGTSEAGDDESGDDGTNDTETNDTGTNDTGTNDTGTNDTGTNDTGTSDTGTSDTGRPADDGSLDGSLDGDDPDGT